jgi:hypothetical protein
MQVSLLLKGRTKSISDETALASALESSAGAGSPSLQLGIVDRTGKRRYSSREMEKLFHTHVFLASARRRGARK